MAVAPCFCLSYRGGEGTYIIALASTLTLENVLQFFHHLADALVPGSFHLHFPFKYSFRPDDCVLSPSVLSFPAAVHSSIRGRVFIFAASPSLLPFSILFLVYSFFF